MFSGTVWYNCKGKKGFQKYSYQKLSDELEEYAASFPMMTAQELVEWARHCHPNVSIHAYDSTWRKFMKHIASKNNRNASLVFYIEDHHLYPIQDNHLKHIATQARGSEWGGPLVGCRLKFSNFVGSRLKFSIFVGSRLNFSIFAGCRKIAVNK